MFIGVIYDVFYAILLMEISKTNSLKQSFSTFYMLY